MKSMLADENVYRYVLAHTLREHPEQTALREATRSYPHAGMQISPEQGQFMSLLVKLLGARRAIEIGVFTGYGTLCVALALPEDGLIVACDIDEAAPRVGIPYWERAGVARKIALQIGPAASTLAARIARGESGEYDFVFIDADKIAYDTYYESSLQLLRTGGLIMLDNTLRNGEVAYPSDREDVRAMQALNEKLHHDPRIDMVLLPISDGVTLVRKR